MTKQELELAYKKLKSDYEDTLDELNNLIHLSEAIDAKDQEISKLQERLSTQDSIFSELKARYDSEVELLKK